MDLYMAVPFSSLRSQPKCDFLREFCSLRWRPILLKVTPPPIYFLFTLYHFTVFVVLYQKTKFQKMCLVVYCLPISTLECKLYVSRDLV